jgi:hypothetical protein
MVKTPRTGNVAVFKLEDAGFKTRGRQKLIRAAQVLRVMLQQYISPCQDAFIYPHGSFRARLLPSRPRPQPTATAHNDGSRKMVGC